MARRPRGDAPGSWHHVINRAIAKRPYFETRSDKRYFLSRLATQVRAGRMELHAYCLMTTHYHLLVRSPIGKLSEAMRRAQWAYTCRFNRRRSRDGPLIRARFFSKRIDTLSYRRAVVRYIDANAVEAGIVETSDQHEFSSARSYIQGSPPPWLSADWIVSHSLEHSGAVQFDSAAYLATFGPCDGEDPESLRCLVELRMASSREVDPLDDLIGAKPDQVQEWLGQRARLADGMRIGLPVCGPPAVHRALDDYRITHGEWWIDFGAWARKGSQIATTGLLRDLCSLPLDKIAHLRHSSVWRVTQELKLHHALLKEGGEHAGIVGALAHRALTATIPD